MGTKYKGTGDELRALNAYITLLRASESVSTRTQRHLADFGLTVSQFGALEALHHLGPMCQRELGAKLLRTSGNVTLVVDNLEKRGLVRREPDPHDRRMVSVHITPEGEALIACVLPSHIAGIVEDLRTLSPDEQEQLRRLCRKLGRREGED